MTWELFNPRRLLWYWTVVFACEYLWLDLELMSILSILVIVDFVTGIIKAIMIWEKISSKKMRSWAASKILLVFIPFIAALWMKSVWMEVWKLLASMIWILCVAESYSSIANIAMAIKWEKMEEFDIISLVLSKILAKIKSIVEKMLT